MTPDLFSTATLPYAKGSPTSRSGAISAQGHAEAQHDIALRYIKNAGMEGRTMQELKDRTGIKESSTMSRVLNTLKRRGLIMDSGRERPGVGNAMQTVYVAV